MCVLGVIDVQMIEDSYVGCGGRLGGRLGGGVGRGVGREVGREVGRSMKSGKRKNSKRKASEKQDCDKIATRLRQRSERSFLR